MEIFREKTIQLDRIEKHLNQLLADEYILMNKTVKLINYTSLPYQIPTLVYDELKVNVNDILTYLRKSQIEIKISIDHLLTNTRLQTEARLTGIASMLQNIIGDHQFIIIKIDDEAQSFDGSNTDYIALLQCVKARHALVAAALAQQKMHYVQSNALTA